jgi:DNA-binding transcriptional ArsR family regulator
MRPLFHPSANEIRVESILHALSDPVRLRIYMDIARADCPQICSNFTTVMDKTLPKSTLSQHFKILREAGLIRSERHGVAMRNVTRCAELKERFGPLIASIIEAYQRQEPPPRKIKKREKR